MKREGRQHGFVRTFCTTPYSVSSSNKSKMINPYNSPTTAGIFTRVASKPTNHSKFTGKCDRARCTDCHLPPACRSKDKIKGTHKLNSSNRSLDYGGFMAWRVADNNHRTGSNKLKLDRHSASSILDELATHQYDCDYDYEDDDDDDGYACTEVAAEYGMSENGNIGGGRPTESTEVELIISGIVASQIEMEFFDVGVFWDPVDQDEEWSLVGQM